MFTGAQVAGATVQFGRTRARLGFRGSGTVWQARDVAASAMRGLVILACYLGVACKQPPQAPPASAPVATAPAASAAPGAGTCAFVRVEADGAIVLDLAGTPTRVLPFGVDVPSPVPADYTILVGRLPETREPLRCTVRDAAANPVRAQIHYYGWQDKSGDVWEDLAITLLDRGVVRVAAAPFPERAEYLRRQRP